MYLCISCTLLAHTYIWLLTIQPAGSVPSPGVWCMEDRLLKTSSNTLQLLLYTLACPTVDQHGIAALADLQVLMTPSISVVSTWNNYDFIHCDFNSVKIFISQSINNNAGCFSPRTLIRQLNSADEGPPSKMSCIVVANFYARLIKLSETLFVP